MRNVFPRMGTQPTMVDSDDDRQLLRDVSPIQDAVHTPGLEEFALSNDSQRLVVEPPSRRVALALLNTPESTPRHTDGKFPGLHTGNQWCDQQSSR